MRASRTSIPKFGRDRHLAAVAGTVLAMLVMPASALASPDYALQVIEGETTLPQYAVANVFGSVEPNAPLTVSIVRAGVVIAKSMPGDYTSTSVTPQVGDVVQLELASGGVIGSVIYDGLPSIDPSVCAGSLSFSGQRTAGQTVEGGYYSLFLKTNRHGYQYEKKSGSGVAQVTSLTGSAFAGDFLTPLAIGETVWASESITTPLAGGATFSYSSENDRPVGACPVPPPPPPPPPAPPALAGRIFKLGHTTIVKLLKSGWLDEVTVNQPGTVIQDLYLIGGKLPAFAASSKSSKKSKKNHFKRVPAALLLARGVATAKAPGTVKVRIKATKKGRAKLKHAHSVKAVLVTTIKSSSGKKVNLARRNVTLRG